MDRSDDPGRTGADGRNRVAAAASAGGTLGGLAAILTAVRLEPASLLVALFPFLYVTGFALHAVEASFFHDGPSPIRSRDFAGAALKSVALAIGAGAVAWATGLQGPSLAMAIADWVGERGLGAAAFNVMMSATSFMVAYCVIGSATFPFVRRYYESPTSPLRLRVPPGRIVIALQLARGLVATAVLLPLVAGGLLSGAHPWLSLAGIWAVFGALVPLLDARDWPARLRVIHAIEISAFSGVQAFAWCKLLG